MDSRTTTSEMALAVSMAQTPNRVAPKPFPMAGYGVPNREGNSCFRVYLPECWRDKFRDGADVHAEAWENGEIRVAVTPTPPEHMGKRVHPSRNVTTYNGTDFFSMQFRFTGNPGFEGFAQTTALRAFGSPDDKGPLTMFIGPKRKPPITRDRPPRPSKLSESLVKVPEPDLLPPEEHEIRAAIRCINAAKRVYGDEFILVVREDNTLRATIVKELGE